MRNKINEIIHSYHFKFASVILAGCSMIIGYHYWFDMAWWICVIFIVAIVVIGWFSSIIFDFLG